MQTFIIGLFRLDKDSFIKAAEDQHGRINRRNISFWFPSGAPCDDENDKQQCDLEKESDHRITSCRLIAEPASHAAFCWDRSAVASGQNGLSVAPISRAMSSSWE